MRILKYLFLLLGLSVALDTLSATSKANKNKILVKSIVDKPKAVVAERKALIVTNGAAAYGSNQYTVSQSSDSSIGLNYNASPGYSASTGTTPGSSSSSQMVLVPLAQYNNLTSNSNTASTSSSDISITNPSSDRFIQIDNGGPIDKMFDKINSLSKNSITAGSKILTSGANILINGQTTQARLSKTMTDLQSAMFKSDLVNSLSNIKAQNSYNTLVNQSLNIVNPASSSSTGDNSAMYTSTYTTGFRQKRRA